MNGYKNYQTYAVALHLDNDQSYSEAVQSEAVAAWESATANDLLSRSAAARYILQGQLKALLESFAEDSRMHPLVSNLFESALDQVDFYELADGYLADLEGADYEPRKTEAQK